MRKAVFCSDAHLRPDDRISKNGASKMFTDILKEPLSADRVSPVKANSTPESLYSDRALFSINKLAVFVHWAHRYW